MAIYTRGMGLSDVGLTMLAVMISLGRFFLVGPHKSHVFKEKRRAAVLQ
jgi:hypothetical protein